MNAWQRLLAASSLAIGTAWDLITHPKTGGGGTTYNTGATVALTDSALQVSIAGAVMVQVASSSFAVSMDDNLFEITLTPGITAAITTQPIEGQV